MSITTKEALQRASFLLRQAEVENPRREAEALFCACSGRSLAHIYAHGEEVFPLDTLVKYFEWIKRRAAGEPFAYICGEREFMGLPFWVTPDVLIPRPETEILVEAVVNELKDYSAPRILEIGTGSGAVAVMLAVLLPAARITSVDISQQALAVASNNAVRHGVTDRVSLLVGDLYTPVIKAEHINAVVSNPPYIPTEEIERLASGVKDYEPRQALDGGADGLDFYKRLTSGLSFFPGLPELLAFEVGAGQAQGVAAFCLKAGYNKACQIKDLAGIDRVIIATRKKRNR